MELGTNRVDERCELLAEQRRMAGFESAKCNAHKNETCCLVQIDTTNSEQYFPHCPSLSPFVTMGMAKIAQHPELIESKPSASASCCFLPLLCRC